VQPWKAGWDALQADSHASTNYAMQGPFGLVKPRADDQSKSVEERHGRGL